ncbi:MAG: ArnT family glycosyltransferase, partial [Candidatus Roseilinea sp.]|uniref:ArnT family glycosyltransferase n=1 Tax=Candidatus Roseilinea sp. TaxID=2838777 RepID=UPI0040494721
MNSRLARLIIAIAFVALGIVYSFATPIFEKNDEESHAWFAWHLANGKDLPVQVPGLPESPLQREGSQPPLYYWMAAAVMGRFDLSDFWIQQQPNQSPSFSPYAPSNKNLLLITPQKRAFNYEKTTLATVVLRLLGIIPGLLTIWFVYPIAQAVTRDERVSLLAMGLTAFNPMFLQVMTALGNDGLVIALATLSLHGILRAVTADTNESGFSPARVAVIGILIGLASLSKVSGLLLLPIAAAGILGRALIQPARMPFGRRATAVFAQGMGVLGLWALIAGWWYLRNLQLYGDFTGTSIMAQMMTPRDFTLAEALSEWQGFKMSYIAMFGQFAVPADDIVYAGFDALLVASGIGLLICLGQTIWQITQPAGAPQDSAQCLRMLGVGLLALHVVLLLASVLRWTMMTPASHGRLIFPGIAAVSTLMAIGVTQISALAARLARMRRALLPASISVTALIAIVPLLVVAAIAPFRYIWPAYEPPLVSEMPADLIPVQQRMGNLAEVLGYRMQPNDARPGDTVRVTVAMR